MIMMITRLFGQQVGYRHPLLGGNDILFCADYPSVSGVPPSLVSIPYMNYRWLLWIRLTPLKRAPTAQVGQTGLLSSDLHCIIIICYGCFLPLMRISRLLNDGRGYVKSYAVDVNTSRTPEEGTNSSPSWPNGLIIFIITGLLSSSYHRHGHTVYRHL